MATSRSDRTYERIVRAFEKNPAATYRAIARRCRVAQSTVFEAVKRAVREGDLVRAKCMCCGSSILSAPALPVPEQEAV